MAKKQVQSAGVKDLKEALLSGKAVVGIDMVMKQLKRDCLKKILLASNTRQDVKNDVKYYANSMGVSVEELNLSNEELGVICKKNFFVAVVGLVN